MNLVVAIKLPKLFINSTAQSEDISSLNAAAIL